MTTYTATGLSFLTTANVGPEIDVPLYVDYSTSKSDGEVCQIVIVDVIRTDRDELIEPDGVLESDLEDRAWAHYREHFSK